MRTLWKTLVPLALVLPLAAFVAGSLVASTADDPPARETIVIRESGATSGTPTQTATPARHLRRTAPRTRPRRPRRPRRLRPPDSGPDVETVSVEPDDVDDDSDGRSDAYPGGHDDDDSSGPGGGDDDRDDDDNSGPGGGDD